MLLQIKHNFGRSHCVRRFKSTNNVQRKCNFVPAKHWSVYEMPSQAYALTSNRKPYANEMKTHGVRKGDDRAAQCNMQGVECKALNMAKGCTLNNNFERVVTKQKREVQEQQVVKELQYLLCFKHLHEEYITDPLAPDYHEKLAFFEEIIKWFKRKFERKIKENSGDPNQFPGGHPDLHRDYDPFRRSRYSRDRYLYEREREDHHQIHKENEHEKQTEPLPDENDKGSEPPPSDGDASGGGGGGAGDSGGGGGGDSGDGSGSGGP